MPQHSRSDVMFGDSSHMKTLFIRKKMTILEISIIASKHLKK